MIKPVKLIAALVLCLCVVSTSLIAATVEETAEYEIGEVLKASDKDFSSTTVFNRNISFPSLKISKVRVDSKDIRKFLFDATDTSQNRYSGHIYLARTCMTFHPRDWFNNKGAFMLSNSKKESVFVIMGTEDFNKFRRLDSSWARARP